MGNGLLGSIDKKAINEFRKDLLQMLRLGKEIDRYYAESSSDIDTYMKKFSSLAELFNKKYRGLKLKTAKKADEISLKILLNEKSVRDCFDNAASKIIGVQSIGKSGFGAAVVSDAEAFSNELENAKDRLFITYYNPNTGTSNVFLQYDKAEKKTELVYDIKEIENEPSPEFQLAAYYALNEGYNKKINIYDEGATLGFSYITGDAQKMDFLRKFDPHMTD